jgi:hypothetical protein
VSVKVSYPKVRSLERKRQENDPDLGTRYLPSNGTEGSMFEASWCERCDHFRPMPSMPDTLDCRLHILDAAYSADPADRSTWPTEWREDERKGPVCTSWLSRTAAADWKPPEPPILCGGTTSPEAERVAYERAMRGEAR